MLLELKNGERLETFSSWNEASRIITGSMTPKNAEAAKRAIERAGWEVVKVEGQASRAKNTESIVEKFIKLSQVVDKQAIKELERERDIIAASMKSSKDADKLIAINQRITELLNPSTDREAIIAKFTEELDKILTEGA